MEFLLDNLLDLSVAALVSPSGSLGRLAAAPRGPRVHHAQPLRAARAPWRRPAGSLTLAAQA